MDLPFFYEPSLPAGFEPFPLRDETARHLLTVLRKRTGDRLWMTDGRGGLCLVEVAETGKKSAFARKIQDPAMQAASMADDSITRPFHPSADETSANASGMGSADPPTSTFANQVVPGNPTASTPARPRITLAVSMLKNPTRFEWLLEKATEIGVARIVPLICARTEKTSFRQDRLQNILISAMLQSQQVWLPEMGVPMRFSDYVASDFNGRSYIAHCMEAEKTSLGAPSPDGEARILIGPEGDFTPEELELALAAGFQPVSLGSTRLRTETAGMVAVARLNSQLAH